MMPARTVGAGRARDARDARGAPGLSAAPPAWLARVTVGFAGRVVDERDQPLAGALVVAVAACPVAASAGAGGASAAEADADRDRRADPSDAAPALTADLDAFASAGPLFVASTEADGRFVLPVLPPGHYTLFALHIGPPPAASEAVEVNGGFLSVPLRLVISREMPLL
jgi:hypothetical protein